MRSMLMMLAMIAASAQAAPIDAVLDADRAFAAAAKEKGARAAFVEFAARDAIMFRQGVGPVKGIAAIGQAFASPETATAAWEPEGGEIAASGDLAYTWGYFAWTAVAGPNVGKPPAELRVDLAQAAGRTLEVGDRSGCDRTSEGPLVAA